MAAIWIVAALHFMWGVVMLLFPVPRPFGGLEPYLELANQFVCGLLCITVSVLAAGVILLKDKLPAWARVVILFPQQALVAYATAWAVMHIDFTLLTILLLEGRGRFVAENQVRNVLALGYALPLAVLHLFDCFRLYLNLPRWAGRGCSPCPYRARKE
ncbi:MAG: hypothetical protein AB7I42_29520 [Bradyrhizobium sp.]|uniref:hypothetical protein n=1 Tax=Bradyrhizobium sp. TaxID=376 RepID=UPI003D0BA9D7